jgi:hypothetical protein
MQALVARSRELRAVDADPESTADLLVQDCHIRVVGLFLQCEVESAFGQRALTSTLAVVGVDHSDLPRPKFHRAPRPTPAELVRLLHTISTRLTRLLERQGLLVRDALLQRIGVIEAQIRVAAHLLGHPEIQADRLGMANADQGEPAFTFHAWNEVSVDGSWRAVDATWNQVRLNTTHIPLTGSGATLQLITSNTDMSFTIEEVEYFNL